MCSPTPLGLQSYLMQRAAAVPAACPPIAQVPMTLVDPIAILLALISRPAIIRFEIFFE